jgi:hypothetical protein
LSWQVHPPTAYCFGKHLVFLLPCRGTFTTEHRNTVLEVASFLTELSVIDYFFVPHKPSVVALSALLVAIDDVPAARLLKAEFLLAVSQTCNVDNLDPASDDVVECYDRLRLLYVQGGYATTTTQGRASIDQSATDPRSDNHSPVCVSAYGSSLQQPPSHYYQHPYYQAYPSYSATTTTAATASCVSCAISSNHNNPPP